ncbi:VWA domain-containing protein [Paenibacillus sp. JTLBN-2024]
MGIGSWLGLWFGLEHTGDFGDVFAEAQILDTTVPSHLLWQRVDKNLEANRPWQKLQNRLLLWLQLLAAALLVFALMKPYGSAGHWQSACRAGGRYVGKHERTFRFGTGATGREEKLAMMKRMIKDYLEHEAKDGEITLLGMNAEPNLLISREKDRSRALQAVDSLEPYFGRAAYDETLSLASALTRDETDAEVVVFTDGQWRGSRTRCRLGFR